MADVTSVRKRTFTSIVELVEHYKRKPDRPISMRNMCREGHCM